ncbi:MAG: GGDEF domain-containing protein [Betaproteobacteria bacterium]
MNQCDIPLQYLPMVAAIDDDDGSLADVSEISDIVRRKQLTAVFQPIFDYRVRGFLGFEGLIRGPADSRFHSPAALFGAVRAHGIECWFEGICRKVVLAGFARSGLPGKLFINGSPNCLLEHFRSPSGLMDDFHQAGLAPNRVVIELTENQQIVDLPGIQHLLEVARNLGCQFAIDDLGEGFSNLRLWSEIQPEYVKIDRHFIHGIADDRLKLHFVRAIRDLAEICSARLIAEGIERPEDFLAVRDLGLACGQGYFIARPAKLPTKSPAPQVLEKLDSGGVSVFPQGIVPGKATTARSLLQHVEPVTPLAGNELVLARFEREPELEVLPVVNDGQPTGMIHRSVIIDNFSRSFRREIYGRRPCTMFMDASPLIVDQHMSVQELALMLSRAPRRYLRDGFVIVADGQYAGIGSGQALMALITEMQISAARYANPLTQLPGNVPINEHIDRLLTARGNFVACYADLDSFKPFNDAYGYRMGDDVILALAQVLAEEIDPSKDFVGHIGGDDFMILLQSDDWTTRCERILKSFEARSRRFFKPEDIERGGYYGENRRGEPLLHPLVTLSLGVVPVEPGWYESHREVATVAARAKKMAKKEAGSSIFIERRKPAASEEKESAV